MCGRTISGLFHSPCGVLFTFPSRYSFAIGHHRVFSLGGWAPRIRAGFHVSRPTWDPARPPLDFGYGALTPCGRPFQTVPLSSRRATPRSRNPRRQAAWFGLLRFRSPLLAQSRLMSLPAGTEMFHFPASRPRGLCVRPRVMGGKPHRIAPFGNPRIKVCLPLPGAYRSLPRPSSPDGAKASVVRPYTLSRSASGKTGSRLRSVYVAFFPETFSCQRSKIRSRTKTAASWWRQPDSNRRHPACKAGALPTELCPRSGPRGHAIGAWSGRDATAIQSPALGAHPAPRRRGAAP